MTYPKIPITEREKRLCVTCQTFDEFKAGYPAVVPIDVVPFDIYQRAMSIWRHKRNHQISVKAMDNKIVRDTQGKFASTRTEQALLVDVLNELRLLNKRIDEFGNMKDTLAAVRDIHDIMLRVAAQNKQPVHQ